jgi:GNAT superfamily N-acetyltransferase
METSAINFKNYLNTDDFKSMASVRQKSAPYDQVDPLSSLENIPTVQDIEKSLSDDNCNPYKDILIVENGNEVIGYNKIGWWKENDGTYLYLHLGYLIPEYRGKGLAYALLVNNLIKLKENGIKEIRLSVLLTSLKNSCEFTHYSFWWRFSFGQLRARNVCF